MLDKNGITKHKEVPLDTLASARFSGPRTGDHRICHPIPGGKDGSEKRRRRVSHMRVTVKESTPEQARVFAQNLANALRRPIFRWDEDQTNPEETVLEFDAEYKELEAVQDMAEGVAEETGIHFWFWSYTKFFKNKVSV